MAVNPSIQLGTSGNWAIKEDNLLAYKQLGNKFFDREFDFSRGTTATFVGRNGLIQESVLTGTELVTNGDFATDSDWTLGTGWSISNGAASCDGTQTSNSQLRSAFFDFSVDTTVMLSFDVINYSAGALDAGVTGTGQADLTGINANGTYSVTVVSSAGSRQVDIVAKSDFIGSIDNVSVKEIQTDVPRIDFTDDPTGHLLLEPQSTNLIPYSNDFSQSIWNKFRVSIVPNTAISPNGTIDADSFIEDSTNNTHVLRETLAAAADSYTFSVFVKSLSGNRKLILNISNGYALFNIENGIVESTFNISNANITNYGNGWFKCSVTKLLSAGSNVNLDLRLNNGSTDNYLGDGSSGFFIWGAQVEQNSYPTSYIPTSGSAVTRNQELCNNSGTVNDFNSEEGVLYAEIAALANDGTNRIISLSDGSTSNVVRFYYSPADNQIVGNIRSGGTTLFNFNNVLSSATDFLKVAISYKLNEFKMYVNGTLVSTDTSGNTPVGLSQLSFNNGASSFKFYGKTKNLKVFKRALTDAELQELTT